MSEIAKDPTSDLADTRWILAETHRALEDARQRLRQMDKSMNDARSWLSLVDGFQRGRVTSMDHQAQGETSRSFAAACEDAVEAGLGVDRRISRAVANVKAAVVMVDGLHLGSTQEEIDTGRLRRQLTSLQEDLGTTRPLMQRVSERLGAEADRARQSVPRPGRDRAELKTARVSGSLLTAFAEGRYVDQELGRAKRDHPGVTRRRLHLRSGPGADARASRALARLHHWPAGAAMTGVPLEDTPADTPPADGLALRLAALHGAVSTCQEELERWGEHALREPLAAQVVLDQADLLRHILRGAPAEAAQLRVQVRDLEQHPGVVRIATSPVTLAVVTAASPPHAAVHAMSPASSGLCRGEQFAATVDTSLCASRRFLRVACSALLDAARLLRITQPGVGDPARATGGHRPHLCLVPDPEASNEL